MIESNGDQVLAIVSAARGTQLGGRVIYLAGISLGDGSSIWRVWEHLWFRLLLDATDTQRSNVRQTGPHGPGCFVIDDWVAARFRTETGACAECLLKGLLARAECGLNFFGSAFVVQVKAASARFEGIKDTIG